MNTGCGSLTGGARPSSAIHSSGRCSHRPLLADAKSDHTALRQPNRHFFTGLLVGE